MTDRFGANSEKWRYYSSTLGLTADLLPVVSNPHATISERSTMQALGKTPSVYNSAREVVGLGKWTSMHATPANIERWAAEPDYGICIQTRRLRAIDVDVDDPAKAKAICDWVRLSGFPVVGSPVRRREGSGRCLLPFLYEGELFKHVIPVDGGMIEILGDGQQFVAEGTHPSGQRYYWEPGIEGGVVGLNDFWFSEAFLPELTERFATGPVKIARKRDRLNGADLELDDPVAAWLLDNWETYDDGQDGQLFIRCPFEGEHSTDSGPTSTAYFPAGSGGYADGNFVCLHAHCTGRPQADFLNASGFTASQFADAGGEDGGQGAARSVEKVDEAGRSALPASSPERENRQALIAEGRWPTLQRDSNGKIEATMNNLLLAIDSPAMVQRFIAYDSFKDVIVWAPSALPRGEAQWRLFRDIDYALVRQQLELRGMKPMGHESLRLAVLAVADLNKMDTATEWLNRLEWDGVPRIDGFAARGWGWAETPYAVAVSRYVWTALAGRVLSPGCQADMAPVLIGPQGWRKTSAIKAMVPSPDFYTEINLAERDDDTSRKMRGTLVGELEELRGLNSKASEEIKAFISRTHEEWTPKYREFSSKFPRRLLFFGSGNDEQFLSDPTGERRWLPGICENRIDVDWIEEVREQLWAEGALLWRLDGIEWLEAERLARGEHHKFKVADAWEEPVQRWLEAPPDEMEGVPVGQTWTTISQALAGALGIGGDRIDRGKEMRMGRVLRALGFERVRKMDKDTGKLRYVYARVEEGE